MFNLNESIFYHIYPLGFCNSPHENDSQSDVVHRLELIYEYVDHIKNLGANTIFFGPLFESVSHGYDTSDYYHVDRRLGNRETLANLVNYLHSNNIKVIFDAVFNHVGRNFWAFRDVIRNGSNSQYINWFHNLKFNGRSPYGDPFTYESWEGHYNLVKLNLENPDVKAHLFGAVEMWINELGCDGLRMDAADCLSINFIKELNIFCKKMKPDFFIKGEIIHGDYRKWINQEMFDSVTNYECYKGLYSSHNDKNYFEIAYSLNRQFSENGIYKNMPLYSFVDNHDVERIGSILKNQNHFYPLHSLLFTIPGLPSIYYGSEWATKGKKIKGSDKSLRAHIHEISEKNDSNTIILEKFISKLANARKNLNALKYGDYKQIYVNHQQLVFSREYNNEKVIVAVNSAEQDTNIPINLNNERYYDFLNEEHVDNQNNSINVKANWSRILSRV